MRIYFKQGAVFIICLIFILIGIYTWNWWQKYKLVFNHFTHPTPKTNLNDLEKAILVDTNSIFKCQHFAQGKQSYIVDSKGYLCERQHLEKLSGCCQTTSTSIRGPYICDTCSLTTHCCSSFEDCISCCLKPDHRNYLQNYIRSRDLKTKLLLSYLSTSFDLCDINIVLIQINMTNNNNTDENYLPFNIQWLDSSYQQTCLPDSPWQKVLDDLEPALANRIRQQFNNPQRRQIILELVGRQFQWKLFPTDPHIPHLLIPPYMLEERRYKLESEAKSWLQIQTFRAAIETKAAVSDNEYSNQLSNNMKEFLEYSYEIISKSFQRYIYHIEEKSEEQKIQDIYKKKHLNELTGQAKLRFILRDAKKNSKKLPIINESTAISNSMSSKYSDIISNSIIALLKSDIRRVIFIKEKLFGQQLPLILRQFVWTECLFRFEKKPLDHNLSFVEFQTRREFAAGVTRGKNELKLKNPSNSPITNFIENSVIETYSKTPALNLYLEEQHLRFTIKILNVLYTYKQDYEPVFIYWLLPFQLSYNDEVDKDEEIYVNAMYLDLFIRHCFPKWIDVLTIANKIMLDISINDREFYDHLKTISKIRTKMNPQDFFRDIISLDSKQNDPILFLRKWVGQMFVGILHSNSVLYLWDQFFMIKWNIDYIEHAARAIFYLLRDCFMCATDYEEMRKVFLEEPYRLYTLDIQTAFIHLALRNDELKYIPGMNRRVYPYKPNIITKQKIIGIKNISLSLIMPVMKDPLHEFRYKSIIIEVQVYENGERLDTMSTKSIPIIQRKVQTINDWQKIILDIPNDKLILSVKKTHQSFVPTRIQALVIVHQRLNILTLKTIAYCRFPLYIPRKIGNLNTWDVTFGPIKRTLHPGIPPISIDTIPDTPKAYVADKIGPNSTISLIIFDPKAEEHLIW